MIVLVFIFSSVIVFQVIKQICGATFGCLMQCLRLTSFSSSSSSLKHKLLGLRFVCRLCFSIESFMPVVFVTGLQQCSLEVNVIVTSFYILKGIKQLL